MEDNRFQRRRHPSLSQFTYLATGKSGIVYQTGDGRIVKDYYDSEGQETEYKVYERLGSHPNIANFLGCTDDGAIILGLGQVIRGLCKRQDFDQVSLERKISWLRDAAEGLQYMHEKGIIHADVGCHNMVLVDDHVKLIDFEGCSIDNGPALSVYEWFSYKRFTDVSIETDVFAFGCAVYEIITSKTPYHEFAESTDHRDIMEQLHKDKIFPSTEQLPLAQLMQGCWDGSLGSMSEVLKQIKVAECADGRERPE